MTNLERMLNRKVWNNTDSSVWREIVSRFGQADYDDETKRAGHETTLEAEWTAHAYGRTRKSAYPEIGDQLDDLYKEGVFSASMAAKLKKVKDDNPKG